MNYVENRIVNALVIAARLALPDVKESVDAGGAGWSAGNSPDAVALRAIKRALDMVEKQLEVRS